MTNMTAVCPWYTSAAHCSQRQCADSIEHGLSHLIHSNLQQGLPQTLGIKDRLHKDRLIFQTLKAFLGLPKLLATACHKKWLRPVDSCKLAGQHCSDI